MNRDRDFRVRLGRGGDRRGSRRFVSQVIRAAVQAGYLRRAGGAAGARAAAGRGRGAALAARLRSPGRRVTVKARVVRHRGGRRGAAPLALHLKYLQRDGTDRSGGEGRLFGAAGEADGAAFARRCEDDRHHFRFIISPEDARQMADLPGFTRDLMGRAAADLGTRLDWVAAAHWNTAHPHVHVLLRGVADDGGDLVIARDYIAAGLRSRAETLVGLELGPRSAREIAASLERDSRADHWTRLDAIIARRLDEARRLDLRAGAGGVDRELRPLLLARMTKLSGLGLAQAERPGVWRVAPEHRDGLQALARRGAAIEILHAVAAERPLAEFAPLGEAADRPIVGRLAARGLADEHGGAAYVVIDAVDGRLHHAVLPSLEATGDTPVGGLVELQPAPSGADGGGPAAGAARLVHRSDLDLASQVTAEGATWLDRQLVTQAPLAMADAGFGAEVLHARSARLAHLESLGLARPTPGGFAFAPNLLATLRERELAAAGARLAAETGLRFEGEPADVQVRGRYRRRVDLASGRFAMVEDGLGFRLAPWARALDRQLGQAVSGEQTRAGMSWDLRHGRGRER